MESVTIPVTTIDSGSKEIPPTEALTAAVVMVSSTSPVEMVTSGDAVLLKTSSTSIVVFPLMDGLKNRLPAHHDATIELKYNLKAWRCSIQLGNVYHHVELIRHTIELIL